MLSSAWRYLQCKLGGSCAHLEQENLAMKLVSYLTPNHTTPSTILLAVAMVGVSAVLVYFKPDPRQMFQKVKSALRMGPDAAEAIDETAAESEPLLTQPGGDPQQRVARVAGGVPVYPPEVYQRAEGVDNEE